MKLTASTRHHHVLAKNPEIKQLSGSPAFFNNTSFHSSNYRNPSRICLSVRISNLRRSRLVTACITRGQETPFLEPQTEDELERLENIPSVSSTEEERETAEEAGPVSTRREEFAPNSSIWNQMGEIVKFSGPATGLWICGPLMSLIDTAVIGQGSSLDLAALGPGTVLCDNMSYIFMFLSIATSNMVATALARQGRKEVQRQISILLFVGLACGVFMLLLMKSQGTWLLTAFTGPKNAHVVPAANKYVQIRALAWPAVLVGWVAQSASLGMKDSWGPLKALAVASTVNIIGHVILCSYLGYGIAGAAWATMVSQVISAFMMIEALKGKGYSVLGISPPSPSEITQILTLSAPVFVTISSKVAFYSLIIYFATSMGTVTVAAHQVLIQLYSMCVVWGEPLSQTAQSFMPELMYGFDRNLAKARMLLKSLAIIGSLLGLLLGTIGTSIPWFFPRMFTSDPKVIQEMHKVSIPFFIALCVTPCTHSFEGTLLAGRDLKFISFSMSGCFFLGSLLLLLVSSRGYGLLGCWCVLVGFQWARFFLTLRRLISPHGILYSEDSAQYQLAKPKIA